MKKKSLLISGLIFLGAAIGVTSYAISSGVPGINLLAEGDEEGEEPSTDPEVSWSPLSYLQTIPADMATIQSTDNLQTIFVKTNAGGDRGIGFLSDTEGFATKKIQVFRNDILIEDINVEENKNTKVVLDASWPNAFNIKLSEPLTEPGEYKVVIPDYIVGGIEFGQDGAAGKYNPSLTIYFNIVRAIDYTVTPGAGNVTMTQLNEVKITYPAGSDVYPKKNATSTPELWLFKQGVEEKVGTYTVSASEDGLSAVLSLQMDEGKAIEQISNIKTAYYHIEVPSGLWTIMYNDVAVAAPAYSLGNWAPQYFTTASFKLTPAPGAVTLAADYSTLTIEMEEGASLANERAMIYLKYTDIYNQQTTSINYNNPEVLGNKVVYSASTANNYQVPANLCTSNGYYIEIPANTFQYGTAKNAKLEIGGYNIKGIETVPIYQSSPANNSVQTSCQSISLSFQGRARMANPDAEVVVKKDGDVVNTFKLGEKITSAALKTDGKGSTSASSIKFIDAQDKGTGVYEISFPAGCFENCLKADNEAGEVFYKSEAYNVKFYLNPTNPECVKSPTQYTEGPVENIKEVTFTYPEGTVLTPINDNISVTWGTTQAKNFPNLYPSGLTVAPTSSVTIDKNVVTVKVTNEPISQAMAFELNEDGTVSSNKGYVIECLLPAGQFWIESNGSKMPNLATAAGFNINEVAAPELFYESIEDANYNIDGTPLTGEVVVPLANIVANAITTACNGVINTKWMQSNQGLNTLDTEEVTDEEGNVTTQNVVYAITLQNENGEDVAKFEYNKDDSKAIYRQLFLKAAEAEKVPGGTHKYNIHIPARAIRFNSTSTGATSNSVVNNKEWNFPITIANEPLAKDVVAATPDNFEFELAGNPLGMAQVKVNVPKYCRLNPASKDLVELIHNGETVAQIGLEPVTPEVAEGEEAPAVDENAIVTLADNVLALTFSSEGGEAYTQLGGYQVVIPNGLLISGLDAPTASTAANCYNIPGGVLEYTIVAPVDFDGVVTPVMPASFDFKISESLGADDDAPMGMAGLAWGLPGNVTVNEACTEKIQLVYGGETIAELGAQMDEETGTGILIQGAQTNETAINIAFVVFGDPSDAKFSKAGEYKVIVPKGFFKSGANPVLAGELTYTMAVPVAFDGVFMPMMPESFDFNINQSYGAEDGEPVGMAILQLMAQGNIAVNEKCTEKVALKYGALTVAELPAVFNEDNGTGVMTMGVGMDERAMTMVNIVFDYSGAPEYLKGGAYEVVIPAGFFTVEGQELLGGTLNYNMTVPVEFAGLLTPGAPSSFEFNIEDTEEGIGMGMLQLVAPAGFALTESSAKATLVYGDEVIAEIGNNEDFDNYKGIFLMSMAMGDEESNILILSFNPAGAPELQKDGKYTINFPEGLFTVNGQPVLAGSLEYTMTVPVKSVPFADAMSVQSPASEFKLDEGVKMGSHYFGMAAIMLGGVKGVSLNAASTEKAQLFAGDKLIAEVGVEMTDNSGIIDQGFSTSADDDDPIDWGGVRYLIMFNAEAPAEFTAPGEYTVVIPEGLFKVGDALVGGTSLKFTLLEGMSTPTDFAWTLTPADGTEFTGSIAGPITLTVEGAQFIDYSKAPAHLYKQGETTAMNVQYYAIKNTGTSLEWSLAEYPNNPAAWTDGTYEFRIPAYSLWINRWSDEEDANFPTEDIVITYILKDAVSGVALVGVEAADSYTVYTMDGKVVLLNATADQLVELENGMYIINGKKAYVRK